MTFKHIKFQDSSTMRSFEQVARGKGWVQDDLVKSASTQQVDSFVATDNLTENILKLCNGLKQRGFEKYAAELENKFISYKQASTLYDVSSETGEDLVDAAHPDGSHKLENVDADEALVETILDQHVKNLKMIEKMPTGKLASSKDILKAVKLVLAQDKSAQINENMKKLQNIAAGIVPLVKPEITFDNLNQWQNDINELSNNPTLDNLEEIINKISWITSRLNPSAALNYMGSALNVLSPIDFKHGLSKNTWAKVKPNLDAMTRIAIQSRDLQEKLLPEIAPDFTGEKNEKSNRTATTTRGDKVQEARMSLNGIISLVEADTEATPQDVNAIKEWIAKVDAALKSLESRQFTTNPADVEASLAKITKDFARVRQEWL